MVSGGEDLTESWAIADDTIFARCPDAGKPRKLSKEEEEGRKLAKALFEEWLEESGISERSPRVKSSGDSE
jgi:hypothetical protein